MARKMGSPSHLLVRYLSMRSVRASFLDLLTRTSWMISSIKLYFSYNALGAGPFSSSALKVETDISFVLSKLLNASSISIEAMPRRRYSGATARQQIMLCPRENNITPTISLSSFTQIACRLPMNLRTVARCSFSLSCVSRPGKFHRTRVTRHIHCSISSGTP